MSSVWERGLPFVQRIDVLSRNRSTVRVYPHHNNIGVWWVWEAGGFLAKYFIKNPDTVLGRSVMEVGLGAGLTGLVVVGLCRPSRVSRYTPVVYANIRLSNPI